MTGLSPVDGLILVAYVAAILYLGFKAATRRKTGSEDYILAGRGLTLPAFVATLVTSFYGGVLGVGEYTYRYGVSNWVIQGLPYYVFALLYAAFLAGKVRARKGLTIPDHLEQVYGPKTAALAALLVFVLASPADDVLMLGSLASWITGWRLWICVLAVTVVATSYLVGGGLRSEIFTGRLEFVLMFGGFGLILPFGLRAVGGFSALASRLPPLHLSWSGGNSGLYVLSWFFIALWTFVDPAFHQRVCAAKDARTARRGIILSVLCWACFDFMTTFAGLCARALLPNLEDPLTAYPTLAARVLPPAVLGLFFAGVSASIIAALGAKNFLAAVSLGKDALGRWWPVSQAREERRIKGALLFTSALAAFMALALPSVVGLWYTIGSTTIPGLLVVLVSSYVEPLRVRPQAAYLACAAGWIGALGAWAYGSEVPFYPGLAAALSVWAFGKFVVLITPKKSLALAR